MYVDKDKPILSNHKMLSIYIHGAWLSFEFSECVPMSTFDPWGARVSHFMSHLSHNIACMMTFSSQCCCPHPCIAFNALGPTPNSYYNYYQNPCANLDEWKSYKILQGKKQFCVNFSFKKSGE